VERQRRVEGGLEFVLGSVLVVCVLGFVFVESVVLGCF